MTWAFDATPLIYLATIDRLSLVVHLDASCVIPERVYEEVVTTGLDEGYPDARRIERCVDAGQFGVVAVESAPLLERLRSNEHLSDADAAVLAYAAANDAVAVMDEQYGRDIAAAEGITTRGTAYLVVKLVRDGAVAPDDARTVIDAMVDEGWYCAPDVYARIVQKLEAVAD